jgi:thiamine-monophosphate kinase
VVEGGKLYDKIEGPVLIFSMTGESEMRETELISNIRNKAGKLSKKVIRGIGDDCAVLDLGGAEYILWAQDMLVEGTHFDLKKAKYKNIGRKAVAVNISDIAAMGGTPEFIQVSLGLPRGIKQTAIDSITTGIFDILKEYKIKLLGGDTVRSPKIVIDVSIVGKVKKKSLTLRSGAKPGDFVVITGPVRDGKKEHLVFSPRLAESQLLVKNYKINAMIDTSDGIAADMIRVCDESDTGCILYKQALPLSGGLSVQDALADKLLARNGKYPGFFVIGEITKKKKERIIMDKKRNSTALKLEGYKHF